MILLCAATTITTGSEVSVAEYGAKPDTDADSCTAFNQTITAARRTKATVIRLPKGTYHFHWDSCVAVHMYVSNTVRYKQEACACVRVKVILINPLSPMLYCRL